MAEYIEREKINYEQWSVGPLNEPLMVARKKTIDSISAADVAPVRHGRWIPEYHEDRVSPTMKHMPSGGMAQAEAGAMMPGAMGAMTEGGGMASGKGDRQQLLGGEQRGQKKPPADRRL